MAITLNKQAIRCEKIAIAGGRITTASSPQMLLYDISRHWRELLGASGFPSRDLPEWSEREEAASEVIVATMTYLQRIRCKNIEQLIRDSIERHARQIE